MKKPSNTSFFGKLVDKMANPVKNAVSSVLESLKNHDLGEDEFIKVEESIMILFIEVIKADGHISDDEVETVSAYFKENYGQNSLNRFKVLLKREETLSVEEACNQLKSFTQSERTAIVFALLNVAFADGSYNDDEREAILKICQKMSVSEKALKVAENKTKKAFSSRNSLVKSSAGLIVALVIISIFILTATYLKSVFFGIILAYLFLPLQSWYAEKFFANAMIARFMNLIDKCKNRCVGLVTKIRHAIFGKNSKKSLVKEDFAKEDSEKKLLLKRSCHAAILTALVSFVTVLLLVAWISSGYYNAAKETLSEVNTENEDQAKPVIHGLLDKFNPKLMDIQLIKQMVHAAEEFLADEAKMDELKRNFLDKYDGLFGFLVVTLGGLVSVILNLLLTLFFFSFFISKMAEFQLGSNQQKSVGDYLVGGIFDSNWLPKASAEAQQSAAGIIDIIIMKLQTWVKGYMWIIIIESTIYTTLFILLGVPYAFILGLIAGCTVLLPFLGPMASCLVTLIVCLATGNTSAAFLVAIILIYGVMNMIVEQFFLYPAFIGEALGLNILETIVVVLLGGLMAGLAGVIFAVPAASIMKYLIPKVYQTVYQTPATITSKLAKDN